MRVHKIHYTEIPVIQVPSTPPGVPPLNLLEQLPYEVVMLHVMLPLDAVAILNLCTASAVIQQICMDEYFWKQKTIRDFGTEEHPLGDDTWKNVYFNNLNLSRKLKQTIQSGDIESVRDITTALAETKLINLNDFITVALQAKELDIVRYFISKLTSVPPKSGALDVLCLMANTTHGVGLFKRYFWVYSFILAHRHPVFILDLFQDLMRCVIQSKKKSLIRYIYTRFLNRYGMDSGTEPQQFVDYARSLGHTEVMKTIRDTWYVYKNVIERTKTKHLRKTLVI